jgi:hypothetical protein
VQHAAQLILFAGHFRALAGLHRDASARRDLAEQRGEIDATTPGTTTACHLQLAQSADRVIERVEGRFHSWWMFAQLRLFQQRHSFTERFRCAARFLSQKPAQLLPRQPFVRHNEAHHAMKAPPSPSP